MTLFHNRRPFDRNRQGRHRSFPYVRQSTEHPPSQFWHAGPRIKLEGQWLEEAGFYANWRIKVTVNQGKLIIEPMIRPLGALESVTFPCRLRKFDLIAARAH